MPDLEESRMSKGKLTETLPALTRSAKISGAHARLSIHPDPLPVRRSSPRPASGCDPEQARQEVLRIDGPVLSEAAGGVIVIDLGDDQDVTMQFLCKVPVPNDVLYCRCGGILSQRFNESLFCRTCGREGAR